MEQHADHASAVVFTLAGAEFWPGALPALGEALAKASAPIVYADYLALDETGAPTPVALPSFSYERMLEQGYGCLLFAIRPQAALAAARAGADSLYALFASTVLDAKPQAAPVRLPGFAAKLPPLDRGDAERRLMMASAAHLQARGITAELSLRRDAALLPSVRVLREIEQTEVSILIPTRDRVDLIRRCITSIGPAVARISAQIIVIDNGSTDPETLDYLSKLEARGCEVLRDDGPFNFSRLNNRAAHLAKGEIICLLNNDIEALDEFWLEEMLSRLSETDVGAVGAKLVWPSWIVQHGGVALGSGFAAVHAFDDVMDGSPGYCDLLCVAREVSAVTAACMATRKSHFLEVGGFDETRFPVNFNDVDYCLKQGELRRRIVFTPDAKLIHDELASRGADIAPDKAARFAGELRALRERWGEVLAADPYYSPMLGLDGSPYSTLAWPPRRG